MPLLISRSRIRAASHTHLYDSGVYATATLGDEHARGAWLLTLSMIIFLALGTPTTRTTPPARAGIYECVRCNNRCHIWSLAV